jgi:pyruvate ferredoxin oxidoreductase alpha subunit
MAFRASTPISQGVAVLGSTPYSYFRYETHLAALNALNVYAEVASDFAETFGRMYPEIETYQCDDAEIIIVMMGSFATKAKAAIDQLHADGQAVGLLRPRLFRPFPAQHFQRLLKGKKGVLVIDQNLSIGKGGILHSELISALYGQADMPPIVVSFVGGLGGRDFSGEEFYDMVRITREAIASGVTPAPRLLFTQDENREIKKLQAIAHVERDTLGNKYARH